LFLPLPLAFNNFYVSFNLPIPSFRSDRRRDRNSRKKDTYGEGLGSLNGKTVSAIPNESRERGNKSAQHSERRGREGDRILRQSTDSSGSSEGDGVEVEVLEAVVVEEGTGGSVDVREGVLGFAVFGENTGSDLVKLVDVFEDGVLDDVLAGDTELLESHETGIGLAENGVTVTLRETRTISTKKRRFETD